VIENFKETNKSKDTVKVMSLRLKKFDFFLIKSVFQIYKNYLKCLLSRKNPVNLTVEGVNVGKYVVTTALRNAEANYNKKLYVVRFHKFLFFSCFVYAAAKRNEKNVTCVFLGDVFYLDGIIIDFFLKRVSATVYLRVHPHNIIRIEGCYESTVAVLNAMSKKNKKAFELEEKRAFVENYMRGRLEDPKKTIFYYDVDSVQQKEIIESSTSLNVIVYAHSFTDVQMAYGYDGFINVYDWLEFSLEILAKQKTKITDSKIFLKLHPNFYREETASRIEVMDRSVWADLKSKLPTGVEIIDYSISNYEFLSYFSPSNTVLISHHGNAIVEGAYLGFPVIGSTAALWFRNFNFIRTWSSKHEYIGILEAIFESSDFFQEKDKNDVCTFIFSEYLDPKGSYSKNAYIEIISRYSGHTVKELIRNPNLNLSMTKDNQVKLINDLANNIKSNMVVGNEN
jgi:hypothetical protein